MKNSSHVFLSSKQLLLFKAAFAEKEDALNALEQWKIQHDSGDLDWATRSLLPLLVQRFPKQTPDFNRYRRYYQQTWLNNLLKFNKLRSLLKELHDANIPVCLLKGAAMLLHYYKNMGMRPGISDIDLLIPRSSLPLAINILERNGMCATSVYKHAGPNFAKLVRNQDSQIMLFHHAINYDSLDMNIDLHWRMSPYIPKVDFESLRKNMQVMVINQHPVYLLSIEDHFVHTCFHGATQISVHAKLWWIMDMLYLLSNQKKTIDWNQVYVLSKRYKVDGYIANALEIVRLINPKLLPTLLLSKYQKSFVTKIRLLQFKIHHHKIKLIKQLFCYHYLFRANQSSYIRSVNPLAFFTFIQDYFGFSSATEVMRHVKNQFFVRKAPTC